MNNKASKSVYNFAIIAAALLSCLILLLGSKLTEINWSLNSLSFFSNSLYVFWLILIVLSMVLLFINIKRHFIADFLNDYLWGGKKLWGQILFVVFALAIFYIFRFEAHLYGDGYIRVANFAQKAKPIFRWYEYGSTLLPYLFFQIISIFGVAKVTAGILAYQVMSILSGGIFVYFIIKISDLLYDDHHDKITSLFLILFSGAILMFFGMVENYPILMVLAAAFYYQIILFNRSNDIRKLIYLWLIAIIGIVFHFQSVTLIPVILYLTVKYIFHGRKGGPAFGFSVSLALIFVGLVFLYVMAGKNIALENVILFVSGKSPEAYYSLFSVHHLLDIFNLLFLCAPLFPVFLIAVLIDLKDFKTDRMVPILVIFMLGQFIYLWLIDPKNGMPRDIPLFGFLMVGAIFRGSYSLLKIKKRLKISQATLMALCPLALVLLLPGISLLLSPSKSEQNINQSLAYNEAKTGPALIALRDYFFEIGNMDKTNYYDQLVEKKSPGALQSRLVSDLYAQSRYNEAFDYANQLVDRYPYNYIYRIQRGNLLKYYKKYDQARAELDTAILLAPYSVEPYHFLSEYYREMGLESKCYELLEKAVSFAPDNTLILTDLIAYHYLTKKFKTADSLSKVAISIDTLEPYPYMYLALIAESYGQLDSAMALYSKFIKINERLPEVPLVKKRMNEIYLLKNDSLRSN